MYLLNTPINRVVEGDILVSLSVCGQSDFAIPLVKAGDIKLIHPSCLSIIKTLTLLASSFKSINDRVLIFGMHALLTYNDDT